METKFETLEIVNLDTEPIIVKKEDKFIAVSIELMNDKYVVSFDIINEENVDNFDIEQHEYETIGIIECFTQKGGYIDCRNDLLQKLDELSIEKFKELYF